MSRTPAEPGELLVAMVGPHTAVQQAILELQGEGDVDARLDAHRRLRENELELLELRRLHNELVSPPPWDIAAEAQMLVQQSMMEADLLSATGRRDEANRLRQWALEQAETYLGPEELGRVQRERADQLALEGRFNEALTALADVRRVFVENGNAIQAAQTALDEAVVLEWLGDAERALEAIAAARARIDPLIVAGTPTYADVDTALFGELAAIAGGRGPTHAADATAALWRVSVELRERERARARRWDSSMTPRSSGIPCSATTRG